jgi:hypothetical protein
MIQMISLALLGVNQHVAKMQRSICLIANQTFLEAAAFFEDAHGRRLRIPTNVITTWRVRGLLTRCLKSAPWTCLPIVEYRLTIATRHST